MDCKYLRVREWPDSVDLYNKFAQTKTQWVFRRLPDANYKLQTSVERVSRRFGRNLNELREIENKMIRRFKRHAPLYLQNPPSGDDTIEWLALMQHFGSPTRFQDWTYSFFVALFFAVEAAEKQRLGDRYGLAEKKG
jgi:hypothetical protein